MVNPLTGDDAGLHPTRKKPEYIVWSLEYTIHWLDKERQRLAQKHNVKIAGGAGSLLPKPKKRDAQGDGGAPAKRHKTGGGVHGGPGAAVRNTEWSPEVQAAILGEFPNALTVKQQNPRPHPGTPIMKAFMKDLLAVKGFTKSTDDQGTTKIIETYISTDGHAVFWAWFNKIFGKEGRERLRSLCSESDDSNTSFEVAKVHIDGLVDNIGVPEDVQNYARALSAAIAQDADKSKRTVSGDYNAHSAMAELGREKARLEKLLIDSTAPGAANQEAHEFVKQLKREFPTKRGVTLKSLLLQWLCSKAHMEKQMSKMRYFLVQAEILAGLEDYFGPGILLFIPTHFASRYAQIPVSCPENLYKVYNSYWAIKDMCVMAWTLIGSPVVMKGEIAQVEVPPQAADFAFLHVDGQA